MRYWTCDWWLTALCRAMQWGTFLFFACCVIVETILVALLFVEPKAVPIEDCPFLFKKHWFWKRYCTLCSLTLALSLTVCDMF